MPPSHHIYVLVPMALLTKHIHELKQLVTEETCLDFNGNRDTSLLCLFYNVRIYTKIKIILIHPILDDKLF